MTEMTMNGSGSALVWDHTNVWATGKIIATYSQDNTGSQTEASLLHFYLDDPLGSRRVQTDYAGVVEKTCQSLPFGDGETCLATPTEHHFTGKERDSESGNDYFGARYYASSIGRWVSPDPTGLALAEAENPQSLNLYAYVNNNPISMKDPDGLQVEPSATSSEGWFWKLLRKLGGGDGEGPGEDPEFAKKRWSSTPYPGKNLVNAYYPCGSFCIGGHVSVGTYDSNDHNPDDPYSDPHNGYGFTTVNQHWYVKTMLTLGWPFFKGRMEPDKDSRRSRIGVEYRYLPISPDEFANANDAINNHNGNYRLWLLPRNCANTAEDIDRAAGAPLVPHHEIFIPHAFWWLSPVGWAQ
jgi:RHS repeat-associated protein